MMKSPGRRVSAGVALVASVALAACSSTQAAAPGASGEAPKGTTTAEIKFWDPYPQRTDGSDWDKLVKACAPQGSKITRTSAPQTDLFNQLTTAAKEGNAPDVVVLDNPMMPEAVTSGLLATAKQASIDTTGVDANLLGPGVVNGEAYGVPFGSNALGLYYNADLLAKAGYTRRERNGVSVLQGQETPDTNRQIIDCAQNTVVVDHGLLDQIHESGLLLDVSAGPVECSIDQVEQRGVHESPTPDGLHLRQTVPHEPARWHHGSST